MSVEIGLIYLFDVHQQVESNASNARSLYYSIRCLKALIINSLFIELSKELPIGRPAQTNSACFFTAGLLMLVGKHDLAATLWLNASSQLRFGSDK